ncbi:MAG: DUF3592 domain-containing protein [Terracidiphilus sp.]|jgi:hypothetical protein
MNVEPVSLESKELPIELRSQTPRRVRLTSTGWLNIFAAALFFAVGVAWGVSAVRWVVNDMTAQDALRQAGRDSSAQVIDKWTTRSVPYVSYAFSVDGSFYTGKSRVPRETWNRLRQDDSLPIRYFPANPNINHPAAWEDATISNLWALLFPVGLAIFGAMFVRRIPLQRRIAMEGIAVRGSVSEREWKGPSKGQTYVDYTFRNASNDEVEIGSCPYDFPPKGGSNVWVLYLPTNPRRSEIYPFGIDFFRIE